METHSVALTACVCSLKMTSTSALFVFGVVDVLCLTAVVVKAMASDSRKEKETLND